MGIECRRGDVIGGEYVIDEVVGVGGMGVVYRATQPSKARTVVVKLPHPGLELDPIVRHRFRIEALAGARIVHRNVARVLDSGEDDSRPFLVMEEVAGTRLGAAARGDLALDTALDVIRQLLGGLAELHAAGVVHGDLKCDNVVVETEHGRLVPRLIDFGLARVVGETAWFDPGMVAGTPEYLAPELVLGALPSVGSDLYAAGVMLFELVTGTTPFQGATIAEVMHRQLTASVRAISELRPGSPPELDAIVGRALAKLPSARFEDASAMRAALAALTPCEVAPRCPTFSVDANTVPMPVLAGGSNEPFSSPVAHARRAVALAVEQRDIAGYIVGHLELAQVLIGDHDLRSAIGELEVATRVAHTVCPAAREAPLWRLQLMLAGLYDWRGDRIRARQVAGAARAQAIQINSAVGRTRADELIVRLGPGRGATRAS